MHTLFVSVDEEVLQGGVANAGGVTRVGAHVLRPSNPHTPTIHRFLIGLRAVGFARSANDLLDLRFDRTDFVRLSPWQKLQHGWRRLGRPWLKIKLEWNRE